MPKTNGPVLCDVARQAGVSAATVDRVLNRRGRVRETTARRVLRAALELGYVEEQDAQASLRPPRTRVAFLLPAGYNPYLQLLGEKVKAATDRALADNLHLSCFFTDSFDPQNLAAALERHSRNADAVAFMGIDHPVVRETAQRLSASGKVLVTVVSDVMDSGRACYVGLDNRTVGRTAAFFMGKMTTGRAGSVGLIAASRNYRLHEEREMGFRGVISEDFPHLSLLGLREGQDDVDENARLTLELLEKHPDVAGIYNLGGSSEGVVRALRKRDMAADVLVIAHGLTLDTRKMLLDGAVDLVLTQSPDVIVRNTLASISNLRVGRPAHEEIVPLRMDIVTRENLPNHG